MKTVFQFINQDYNLTEEELAWEEVLELDRQEEEER